MATTYRNPILPGMAPDPTIIYVDGVYYLSNSSFHLFPGLPIYASKNLKSWTQIGNAINRPEQLSLDHAITMNAPDDSGRVCIGSMGLLAPTLRYHEGTFYMICTNLSVTDMDFKPMNFYVTSKDLWSDVWSDPIYYNWNGIDPSLYFDDDGHVYVQGQAVIGDRSKQPTGTIKQCELDTKTGKLIGDPRSIWGGWNSIDTEGPHVYKRRGWYYCLAAEGGTFEHHLVSISRSRNVWGPYESCPRNPVLTAMDTDGYIQHVGHGDLFEDSDGLWWAVVLAIRSGEGGRWPLSRETFLVPVTWEDDWPVFSQLKIEMQRPESEVLQKLDIRPRAAPGVEFVYIRDRVQANYEISKNFDAATLSSSATDLSVSIGTATFLGKRQKDLEAIASTTVLISAELHGQELESGLALYKDQFRWSQICYSYFTGDIVFKCCYPASMGVKVIKKRADIGTVVQLKIEAAEDKYVFSYKGVTGLWVALEELDTLEFTARDFTGPVFGIVAFGKGGLKQTFKDIALGGNYGHG